MKRLKYQNYLMVKDITGSVKVVELLPDYTNNLDDPNWLYLTCMGTNEISKFIKTTVDHFCPTGCTIRANTMSDTRINILVYGDTKKLTIRFVLDCQDKDILNEAYTAFTGFYKTTEG